MHMCILIKQQPDLFQPKLFRVHTSPGSFPKYGETQQTIADAYNRAFAGPNKPPSHKITQPVVIERTHCQ